MSAGIFYFLNFIPNELHTRRESSISYNGSQLKEVKMANDKLSNYAQMLMPFLFLLRCCYLSGFIFFLCGGKK